MRALLATAVVLAALAPAAEAAAPRSKALIEVEQLQQGKGVKTGRELSPALAHLAAALPSMSPADRRRAESILARPDDNRADPPGTHKWTGPEAGQSPRCTAHFCVHWTAVGVDASNLSHASEIAGILENEVFPCENGTAPDACAGSPGLGWRQPAPDGGLGGNDKTDVYIEDLFTTERVFGYVAVDPGQPQDPSIPHHAYMVLDKDYSRFANGDAARGLAEEQVTAAHEYNHVLQNAYDYREDEWMFEATAVYMEDKVYPQINDYLQFIPAWTANTKQPLTTFSDLNLKAYGSAVWNHWLDHRYGPGVVRAAWEDAVGAADYAPGAYGGAILGAGGAGFSDEFDRFSAAVAEWDAPGSGFPDRYPDVPRDGQLPAGSQTSPFALPHTTFALLDVPIPQGSPPVIRLIASLPAGTLGAVALVGRTGPDPAAGTVTTNVAPVSVDGTGAVQLDDPASYGRITAVVANADPSQAGFDFGVDDYIFTRDAQGVVASVIAPGAPIPATGPASAIRDHSATTSGTVDPHLIDTTWTVEYGRTRSYGSSTAPQKLPASTIGSAPVVAKLAHLRARTTYHYRVVANNSAGSAVGGDMTFRTARDVTPPVVTLKVKRQKLRAARTRGVRYLLRCSERCSGTAAVRLSRRRAKRLGLPVVIGRSRVVLEARPRSKGLRVRLSPRARRSLAGRSVPLAASVRVAVADDSHNRKVVAKRVVLLP